jgi:F0F1-type ATP synthase assembly protein I
MSRWELAFRLVGLGWYIGISIFLGVFGGLWLDNKFNTSPLLAMIGLILGIIVAFFGVYRMIKPLIDSEQDKGEK